MENNKNQSQIVQKGGYQKKNEYKEKYMKYKIKYITLKYQEKIDL